MCGERTLQIFGLILALNRPVPKVLTTASPEWEVLKETMLVLTPLTLPMTLLNLSQYTRARIRALGSMLSR